MRFALVGIKRNTARPVKNLPSNKNFPVLTRPCCFWVERAFVVEISTYQFNARGLALLCTYFEAICRLGTSADFDQTLLFIALVVVMVMVVMMILQLATSTYQSLIPMDRQLQLLIGKNWQAHHRHHHHRHHLKRRMILDQSDL